MGKLDDYIKNQLAAGRDLFSIRSQLIQAGYSKEQIDSAVDSVYQQKSQPIQKKNNGLLIIILAVSIALIVGIGVYLLIPSTPKIVEGQTNLQLELISNEVFAGDVLSFNVVISKTGNEQKIIQLKEELVANERIFVNYVETITTEKTMSKRSQIILPKDIQAGQYTLRVIADFDTNNVVLTSPVIVKASTLKEEGACPICDDNNPCTNDYCSKDTGYKCVYAEQTPCCGNFKCESTESYDLCPVDCQPTDDIKIVDEDLTLTQVIDTVKNFVDDPPAGGRYCNTVPVDSWKDRCFREHAVQTNQSNFCTYVLDARSRDNCWMDFVISTNNFDLCQKISSSYYRQSCEMLGKSAAKEESME